MATMIGLIRRGKSVGTIAPLGEPGKGPAALEEAAVSVREDRQPRCHHIALLIGCLGTGLIWYWTAVFTGSIVVQEPPARLPRFEQLCNRAEAKGEEGVLSDKARESLANLTLQGLVLTHRHGDRSAIHDVPGNLEVTHFSCAPDDLEELWSNFPTDYEVISAALDEKPLKREFAPKLLKDAPDAACARGQLTAPGFRQLLSLGRHLHEAYSQFMSQLLESLDEEEGLQQELLYVRSTDYTRTLGSVAALLTTLLPGSWPRPVQIRIFEDESKEIMHGIGYAASSKATDGAGEKVREGSCPKSTQSTVAQIARWQQPQELTDQIQHVFGEPAARRLITDLADAVYAHVCHGLPLPQGPGGRLSPRLAQRIATQADRFICARFAGSEGGLAASKLAMYPFIAEVLRKLEEAAASQHPRLTVYSGHDNVIAPLLAALGLFNGEQRCRWCAYASRVVFELYKAADSTHYVRVVFNGKALRGVVGCDGSGAELCPLANLTHGVESLLGGAPSLEAACAV